MENIGNNFNSISRIEVSGISVQNKKEKIKCFLDSITSLAPCQKQEIIANPKDRNLIGLWFATIKIVFVRSRSIKIRLRHSDELEIDKVNFLQFYFERYFFQKFPDFYHKHIYDVKKRINH